MGLIEFFGGGTPAQKALKLKSKITQKYGDPTTRQKAIHQIGELKRIGRSSRVSQGRGRQRRA
jgi:hypothetical protein